MSKQLSKSDLCSLLKKSDLDLGDDLAQIDRLTEMSTSAKTFAELLIKEKLLTKWQFLELATGRSEFRIGKYLLKCLIDEQAEWSFYSADHIEMDRCVTLQVQRESMIDELSFQRFRENARRLAALNHPNVAHVYDFDDDGNRCHMVLEEYKGKTLHDVFQGPELPSSNLTSDYLKQLASGLNYLHQQSIVHEHLRSSKVLIDESHRVRIWGVGENLLQHRSKQFINDDYDAEAAVFAKLVQSCVKKVEPDAVTSKLLDLTNLILSSTEPRRLLRRFPNDVDNIVKPRASESENSKAHSDTKLQVRTKPKTSFYAALVLVSALVIAVLLITFAKRTGDADQTLVTDDVVRDDQNSESPTQSRTQVTRSTADSEFAMKLKNAGLNSSGDTKSDHPQVAGEPSKNTSAPSANDAPKDLDDDAVLSAAQETSVEPDKEKDEKIESDPAESSSANSETDDTENSTESDNPFENLADGFDLPIANPQDNREHEIGALSTRHDVAVFATLLGGDTAHRRKLKFDLIQKEARRWHARLIGPDGVAISIAEIFIKSNRLFFRWLPDFPSPKVANHLRNCVLLLRNGDHEHALPLRDKVTLLAPIVLSCRGAKYQRNLSISSLPDPKIMRLELAEINDVIPSIDVKVPNSQKISDDLSFTAGQKKDRPIKFEITLSTKRRSPALTIKPQFRIPGSTDWRDLSEENYTETKRAVELAKDSLPEIKKTFDKLISRMKRERASESRMAAVKARKTDREKQIKIAGEQLETLQALCTAIDEKAQIRVRIYYLIGDQEIDLLRCDSFEE